MNSALALTLALMSFLIVATRALCECENTTYLRAVTDCTARTRSIEEAKRQVPYQSVSLCAHGVVVLRDWPGWTCGCTP